MVAEKGLCRNKQDLAYGMRRTAYGKAITVNWASASACGFAQGSLVILRQFSLLSA
jgi:hypothetical protein